ncbi:hypothetical protein [Ascidiaceihabitans sp.]|uniref:hypothetical protein n=1 Tax=Ascidiaceihabitans sp. TaxID=1872644 RepID=UPI00329A6CFE
MTGTPVHIWTASPRAFALRCMALFAVTFALLLPGVPFVGGPQALLAALCLSLIYMFVLDDFAEWRTHKNATWTLTPNALLYQNPMDDLDTHQVSLMDITAVKPRFWWDVVLRLSDGQAVTMRYIENPRQTRDLIQSTKDKMA